MNTLAEFFVSFFRVALGVAAVVLLAVFCFMFLFSGCVFITQSYGYCAFVYWGG